MDMRVGIGIFGGELIAPNAMYKPVDNCTIPYPRVSEGPCVLQGPKTAIAHQKLQSCQLK